MRRFYIYILTSTRKGTLYIGITNNLVRRVYEHKQGLMEGFTKKYNIHRLVYFEKADSAISAIMREKQLKKYGREEKIRLIEESNPEWLDLYDGII